VDTVYLLLKHCKDNTELVLHDTGPLVKFGYFCYLLLDLTVSRSQSHQGSPEPYASAFHSCLILCTTLFPLLRIWPTYAVKRCYQEHYICRIQIQHLKKKILQTFWVQT